MKIDRPGPAKLCTLGKVLITVLKRDMKVGYSRETTPNVVRALLVVTYSATLGMLGIGAMLDDKVA